MNEQLGKLYQRLFDIRIKADYEDLVRYDESVVEPFISETENFLNEIKTLIGSK